MNDDPIAATRHWLERAVIGLNLCPFAKAVLAKRQIRFVLSEASDTDTLLGVLIDELELLRAADPAEIDTTLIVHPQVLGDFPAYNEFLDVADATLSALALDGVLQIASFHPDYCFADVEPDDVTNCTNRSPYPMLHLLREDSVSRAVEAFPDADAIVSRNLATMRRLGLEGYRRLLSEPAAD
jgi:hypothetical protein